VRAFDLETYQTVATYPTETGPLSVAVSPDGARLYVANYGSDNVSVINTTNATSSTIEGLSHPVSLGVLPDATRLYVVSNLCCVKVIDTTTNQIVKSIYVPDVPGALSVSPDGKFVYIVHSFDRTTHAELGRVRLGVGVDGAGPFSIALTPQVTTIDFEHMPGADNQLGTADDVALAGGTGIGD
jgi:YVTN family beta-propeller protein